MKHLRIVILLSFVFAILTPCSALARSYDVSSVSFDTTLEEDGSLSVTEQREYRFSGAYNGIYWDLPRGQYEGRKIDPDLGSVAIVTDNGLVTLTKGPSGEQGTFDLDSQPDHYRLTIAWPAEDETVTFQVSYRLPQLATRWSDVGELYWQYVKADPDSDVAWQNVKARVKLPVPDGEAVEPGKNVQAWAHGPADGVVSFDGDSVEFFSPAVGTRDFLEMRVTLPQEWLAEASQQGQARLDTIVGEEHKWVAEANAKRRAARLTSWGIPGAMVAIGAAGFAMTGIQKRRSKQKDVKAQFDDTYFRDVPSKDHPAVLGMLYHNGQLTEEEFTATLMCLTDQGRLTLEPMPGEKTGLLGKSKGEGAWRLVGNENAFIKPADDVAGVREIDDAAYNFLFDVIAPKAAHSDGAGSRPSVLTSDFEQVAHSAASDYYDGYQGWYSAVAQAYEQCQYRVYSAEGSDVSGLAGFAGIVLTLFIAGAGILLNAPMLPVALALCFGFAGSVCLMLADASGPSYVLTQEGAEVKAKLEALRRWLLDFTRLEEAIPTDVVLWNRLLVMATVLGVADKVIEQLKVALPHLLLDQNFGAYSWYSDMQGIEMPVHVMTRTCGQARSAANSELFHNVSLSDLASSQDSSFDGSGGGFSGGGGGGFSGGGGRGGAF